jgi:hypothetical protein
MSTLSRALTAIRVATFALGMLSALGPAGAAASTANVVVNATVLKSTSLTVLAQPASVVITADDIVRGYVDVPVPAQLAIRSNTAYALDFAPQGNFIRQVLVRGLGNDVQLGPDGGLVPQLTRGVTRTTLALAFRFVLSDSAQQGTYPWPMRVSASSL